MNLWAGTVLSTRLFWREPATCQALNDFRHVKLKYFTHPVSVYPTVQFALSDTCIHLSLKCSFVWSWKKLFFVSKMSYPPFCFVFFFCLVNVLGPPPHPFMSHGWLRNAYVHCQHVSGNLLLLLISISTLSKSSFCWPLWRRMASADSLFQWTGERLAGPSPFFPPFGFVFSRAARCIV